MKKIIRIIIVILLLIVGISVWQVVQEAKNPNYEVDQKIGDDGLPITADKKIDFEYEDLAIKAKTLPEFAKGKECEVMEIPKEYHDTQAYKEYIKYLEEAKNTAKDASNEANPVCLIIQEMHGLYLVENAELNEKLNITE